MTPLPPIEIRLEHTDGLGRSAEIWMGGDLLTVCDGISADRNGPATEPGPLEEVKLSYVTIDGFSMAEALTGNPSRAKRIETVGGWSYAGYGVIVSIMPIVIDFGLARMEEANWSTDERLVGRYVRIPIDRLEIVPDRRDDWPENMK